jgi:hypothetical protein
MQPVQAFTTRTLVRTRMRGTASNGAHGAVFYINVAITSNSYAALFADAHLTGVNQQEVNFVNPIAGQGDTELMSISGFDGAPIEIELDIDPDQLSFTYRINGTPGGPLSFAASSVTSSAGFGTAYSTAAAFDELNERGRVHRRLVHYRLSALPPPRSLASTVTVTRARGAADHVGHRAAGALASARRLDADVVEAI